MYCLFEHKLIHLYLVAITDIDGMNIHWTFSLKNVSDVPHITLKGR